MLCDCGISTERVWCGYHGDISILYAQSCDILMLHVSYHGILKLHVKSLGVGSARERSLLGFLRGQWTILAVVFSDSHCSMLVGSRLSFNMCMGLSLITEQRFLV